MPHASKPSTPDGFDALPLSLGGSGLGGRSIPPNWSQTPTHQLRSALSHLLGGASVHSPTAPISNPLEPVDMNNPTTMKTLSIPVLIGSLGVILTLTSCGKERPEPPGPLMPSDIQHPELQAIAEPGRPYEDISALPKRPGPITTQRPNAGRTGTEPAVTPRPQDPGAETEH